MRPGISVLMSVYNGGKYLHEAVDSILAQSFADFEFVVVDDGSSDGSADLLDSYRDTRLKVHHIENRGLPAALNYGLEQCRSELVVRMDADDVAYPHRFKALLEDWDSAGRPEVFGSGADYIAEDGSDLWGISMPVDDAAIRAELLAPAGGLCIMHPTVLLRKGAVGACGGYDPYFKNGQDYDLWLRMSTRCRFGNSPRRLLKYRFQPASDTATMAKVSGGELNLGNWMRLLSLQKKLLIDAGQERFWHLNRDRIVAALKSRTDIAGLEAESAALRGLTEAKIHFSRGNKKEGILLMSRLFLRHPGVVCRRLAGCEREDISRTLLKLADLELVTKLRPETGQL